LQFFFIIAGGDVMLLKEPHLIGGSGNQPPVVAVLPAPNAEVAVEKAEKTEAETTTTEPVFTCIAMQVMGLLWGYIIFLFYT
jgi:hypothetical protein